MQPDMEVLLRHCMPIMLKELTLYEDYDGFYELLETSDRSSLPQLAAAISGASTQLESLAVSFIIDARDFFLPFSTIRDPALPDFPRLQFIVLTSNELSSDKSPICVNNLLRTAGSSALKMPELQVMELWNGRRGEAAIFRYERRPSNTVAIIRWSSSWDFSPDLEVIAQWKEVAHKQRCRELIVSSDRIPAPSICPGSVLKYIYLRHRILHSLSLYQIQQEADEADHSQAWDAALIIT